MSSAYPPSPAPVTARRKSRIAMLEFIVARVDGQTLERALPAHPIRTTETRRTQRRHRATNQPRETADHVDSRRSTSQTRRHEDTKKSQSLPTDHTDPHRCSFPRGLRPSVLLTNSCHPLAFQRRDAEGPSLDSSVWRGSGRLPTAGHRWAGPPIPTPVLVTVSRPSGLRFISAGLATLI
jgi:hypothetical protein